MLETIGSTLSELELDTELSLMELLVGNARAEAEDSPPQQGTKGLVVEYDKPSAVERESGRHSSLSSHKLTLVNKDSSIKA